MINIIAKKIGKNIEITFSGHAGFATRGSDIVCAGISALYCTLIRSLKNIGTSTTVDGQRVTVKSPNKLERVIIDTILTGVAGIQRSYPDFVYTAVDTREQIVQSQKRGYLTRENAFGNAAFLQLFAKDGANKAELAERQDRGDVIDANPCPNDDKKKGKEVFKVYKTKEEYQKHMDEVIGGRLQEDREGKDRLSKLSDLTQKLITLFGAESEEELLEKLSPAIEEISGQETKNRDFEAFTADIGGELEELPKQLLGDRTAEQLVEDEDFLRLIGCGLSVEDALAILNEGETEIKSEEKIKEPLQPRRERPSENALSSSGTARISKNAEHLTNEELEDIVKRVSRGEKIKF